MSWEFWVTIALLLVLLFGSIPIGFSLGIAGFIGVLLIGSPATAIGALQLSISHSPTSYILVTVPMFMLLANVLSEAGIIKDLYGAAENWLSRLRGGLALSSIAAGVLLGSVSGSTTASASAMARVALPSMKRAGYSDTLSTSSVSLGATLSVLIPPSILLIVYGSATNTSVGKLLIGGLVPGLILAVVLAITIFVWVTLRPSLAPGTFSVSWRERRSSLVGVLPFLLLMLVILGLLYSGIITPTEVGAVGALLAIILGFAMRRLTLRKLFTAGVDTLKITAMIFVIMAGASLFGKFLSLAKVPRIVAENVLGIEMPGWLIIVAIIVAYFVLSMLMDELPLMLMTLPITLPIVLELGYDPVWFGIMSMMMVIMGLIFPPVGMLVFVVSASSGVSPTQIFKGTAVLLIPVFLVTAMLLIWPDIVMWLPNNMQ